MITSAEIQKYDHIVLKRASRYKKYSNYEDLIQEGRMALMQALDSYDPKINDNFEWWADSYIHTRLQRQANHHSDLYIPMCAIKKNNIKPMKIQEVVALRDTSYLHTTKELSAAMTDHTPSVEDISCRRESIEEIREAIDKLPEEIRQPTKMFFGVGYEATSGRWGSRSSYGETISQIAKKLCISRMTCIKRIGAAKKILKETLQKITIV
jgi:RNA polymerase sigma factor (sigma-70 family)